MEFSAQFEMQHPTPLVINYLTLLMHPSLQQLSSSQSKLLSDIMIMVVLLNSIVLSSFLSHQHRKITLFDGFTDTFKIIFHWPDSV